MMSGWTHWHSSSTFMTSQPLAKLWPRSSSNLSRASHRSNSAKINFHQACKKFANFGFWSRLHILATFWVGLGRTLGHFCQTLATFVFCFLVRLDNQTNHSFHFLFLELAKKPQETHFEMSMGFLGLWYKMGNLSLRSFGNSHHHK